ncbi:MAG: hypothetical protein NTX53_03785 [candidate division WOR-3 bacterium]|nr:hypothetical protein [candidate division WOR-3 bacterium]
MPIDPTKRIGNWDQKYNLERVNAILVEKRPKMLEHVNSVMVSLASMEQQVKQVCDGSGVSTIQYPFYLCFGREMWSLIRKDISGESAAKEAAVLVTKWTGRGLTQAVLQAIRTDVFNVSAPVAP